MNIVEMNNVRKDSDLYNGKITKHSPVVEIFAAMTNGESLNRFGKKADVAVKYIEGLGERSENGDSAAIAELNTIRRFVLEAPVMEEIKLLNIFGSYQNVGFDESVEREVYDQAGQMSREQAPTSDVIFAPITKNVYPVPTTNISGGYAVDYRRVAVGDMSRENEGMARVRTDILNKAKLYVVKKTYEAIKNATGVKHIFEGSGLTQEGVDGVVNAVRRNGRVTIIGDYALISQINDWAGYAGTIQSNTILGISDQLINEIAQTGAISAYKGSTVVEMQNPYNRYEMNADGTNFTTLLPIGLGLAIPNGIDSPIATFTRGGLTSFTGNDVKTGKVLTRFDLEVGCDVAKGREDMIGVIYDSKLGGID